MAKWYNLASCGVFILMMLRRSDLKIEATQATRNEGKNVGCRKFERGALSLVQSHPLLGIPLF